VVVDSVWRMKNPASRPELGSGTDMAARLDAALERLETIRATEGEIRRLQARQIRDVAAFIEMREGIDADLQVPSATSAYRSMAAEVAMSMGVSVITAQSFMSDAYLLVASHPRVLGAANSVWPRPGRWRPKPPSSKTTPRVDWPTR
jgi:hypothetical protein